MEGKMVHERRRDYKWHGIINGTPTPVASKEAMRMINGKNMQLV
jgi:hypothetical protein